jgi:hypothetical protein
MKNLININGKSYKKCDVVMLSTKEQRWKVSNEHDDRYEFYSFVDKKLYSRQSNAYNWSLSHLYILSSEEIKEGDWVFDSYDLCVYQIKDFTSTNYHQRKIIATTDESLSKSCTTMAGTIRYTPLPLPRPSDDFIKAFVKAQGKIDKVLVECYVTVETGYDKFLSYKVAKDNTIIIKPVHEEKTSWSREEVLKLLKYAWGYKNESIQTFDEWISKNL